MMPDSPIDQHLSHVQAAMLRGALERASGANVEQVEVVFSAGLAMDRVAAAWAATVARTEALRMGFVIRDGEPCGLRAVPSGSPLQIISEIPASWENWLAADRLQPFPLDGGLPWRAVLWPQARKLVWTFHHALLDGRSIAKILAAFQARLSEGQDPGELGWAAACVPGPDEIALAADFHRRAFAEIEAIEPEFPADSQTTPAQVHRSLGAETVARLEAAALRMDVTAPTLVTWAWGQAVARTAGAGTGAVVGQVRSGPPRPGQAGFSMNTVPLAIPCGGPEALHEFREQLLAMRAIENVAPQDLPAGVFQQAAGPWPGGAIMVECGDLHHQVGKSQAIDSITLHQLSDAPLLASAWIHPELRMEVEVDGRSCGSRQAQSLLDQWAAIVTALAGGAEDPTALPATMRERLTQWENGGAAASHLHLAVAWRDAADRFSKQCALWTPDGEVTYAGLAAQVDHLAGRLQVAGVSSGDPVASILLERGNLAVVLLAVTRLGAIHVPLDPVLPEKRLRSILEDANPRLILTDDQGPCTEFPQPSLVIDRMAGGSCSAELPGDPRETLAILYTSGSTGVPKGVMMVHGGVTNEVLGMAGMAGIGPGDRVLQFASPGFDTSLEEILTTLLSGATLVPRPESLAADLDEFHAFIRSAGITVLDLPTAHWAAWCAWMASENKRIPENVRGVIIGGERASAAAVGDWFASGGRAHLLLNTYGPTEASIVGTAELIRGDWDEPGDPAIGRPLPGIFARIGDATGRRLPPGAAGELWLGGICVGEGYWKRPDLTAAVFRFIDGCWWYRTGDRAWWDDGGKLRFLGRRDDQLKIRGHRVEPNEVIRVLESFPGVSAAHAGPVLVSGGATALAAWVRWAVPPTDGWPGELAGFAADRLPAASIPTRWAAVREFTLTERGKIGRSMLPEPVLTASKQAFSDPPATPTEKQLAALWSGLLGIPVIGRDESFFELGGHSIAALQVFAHIAREWKIRIPMAMLIQAPTLRLLGAVIDEKSGGEPPPAFLQSMVIPVRRDGGQPPLFCIHGGDGGVIFYRDLAEHFPPGRPLLAIESPALAAAGDVKTTPVEETAADYVAALREHQAHGPYYLAGYSYGGLLVYEIARLLVADGETVAFAGLFDTVNPAAPIRGYSLLERAEVFWNAREDEPWHKRAVGILARARDGIATHLRVKKEIRTARNAGTTAPHSEVRMLQVRDAHWEAMENYRPLPLDCRITLFKTRTPDDKFDIPKDYGWSALVAAIEIVEVAGEHLTMFAPKYAKALAAEIHRRL